jgi:PadR family transcriptional regulator PadR
VTELEPKNFLQPCLLLLLGERTGHGYELATRLEPMNLAQGDTPRVYRALRELEQHKLVRSRWETSNAGPARRIYHITAHGVARLNSHAGHIDQLHQLVHKFLDRYAETIHHGVGHHNRAPGRFPE